MLIVLPRIYREHPCFADQRQAAPATIESTTFHYAFWSFVAKNMRPSQNRQRIFASWEALIPTATHFPRHPTNAAQYKEGLYSLTDGDDRDRLMLCHTLKLACGRNSWRVSLP